MPPLHVTVAVRTADDVAIILVTAPGAPVGMTDADATDGRESPTSLSAYTEKVYATPFVRPDTEHDSTSGDAVRQVLAPGVDTTRYPVTGAPLLASAADQVTVAIAAPGTAVTLVGASAGPAGITVEVGADANDVPMPLVALTVKVYEAPFTKPVTTQVVVFVMHDEVPALGITRYSMIAEPLLAVAVHETVTD